MCNIVNLLLLQVIFKAMQQLNTSIPADSKVRRIWRTEVGEGQTFSMFIIKREFSEGAVNLMPISVPDGILQRVSCAVAVSARA